MQGHVIVGESPISFIVHYAIYIPNVSANGTGGKKRTWPVWKCSNLRTLSFSGYFLRAFFHKSVFDISVLFCFTPWRSTQIGSADDSKSRP
jgi:hypothetical protein